MGKACSHCSHCSHGLSLFEGCVLWGAQVVIPSDFREAILAELHEAHPGMSRSQVYPPQAPLQPWSWPSRPWSRLHLDYAGPVNGKMYLVLIDAHSNAFCTASSRSAADRGDRQWQTDNPTSHFGALPCPDRASMQSSGKKHKVNALIVPQITGDLPRPYSWLEGIDTLWSTVRTS